MTTTTHCSNIQPHTPHHAIIWCRLATVTGITIAAATAINLLTRCTPTHLDWVVMPSVLAASTCLASRRQRLTAHQIGLNTSPLAKDLRPNLWALCLAASAAFSLVGMLKCLGHQPPLAINLQPTDWLSWLLYQFAYVAVAEEIFFRGYILGTLLNLTPALNEKWQKLWPAAAVLIAAILFAAAHILVIGQAIAAVTALPAILFGYLRLRTTAVWGPIACHATANIAYAAACAIIA